MNETNNLKFQQTLFQTIIDNDPNGIFVKDLNHNYITVNHQIETIFNLEKEQIIGKCDFDLMDKDIAQDCMNAEKEVLIGLTKSAKLEKMIVVDGEDRHYLIQKNIIHVENEKFILGVVIDITELKLTELKLKSQNTFLENILDSIPLPIYYKNTQSRFVKCNKSFLDFFEIDSIFDIVNKNFIPNCSAEFNILDKESDSELTKKGKIQTKFEFQFEFSSKENIDSIIYKSYYKSENLSGIIGVIVDVTQHKKFENILKEFNEQLERQVEFEVSERLKTKNLLNQIIEATFDAIVVIDDEEKVKIWNKAAEIIFGYTKVEIIGKVLHEHIMPKNLNKNFENAFKNFKQSGDGTIFGKVLELEVVKKDGTSFPVEVAVSRMKIDNKWHAVGVVRDLTNKKQLENEKKAHENLLIQQSKMASMGEMIGVIAHQWKQPLNSMSLIVANILDAFEYEELSEEYLKKMVVQMNEQVYFMSNTIDDFRNFFKPSKTKDYFCAKEAIENILKLLNIQFSKFGITINVNCENKKYEVYGYKNEFKQVVLNILNNAKDAILAIENKTDKNIIIDITLKHNDKNISIEITDHAGGIDENIIDKIFDSYFSTKGELGTGIGLYMSKTIIETNMNGKLSVYNSLDGACFKIELPKSFI